jgi:DNA polymerase-3 subunit gamma/tau
MDRPAEFTAPASSAPAFSNPSSGFAPFSATVTPAADLAAPLIEGALAKMPETAAAPAPNAPSIESLRQAIGSALAAAGHESASQLLGAGAWKIDGASLRIEVPGIGKRMLGLTVNAAAEKIIRQEMQRLSGPTRLLVVPGEGAREPAATTSAPRAGSIQEAALSHPLVQRAQEIFKAEVRSVVDLRQK